jgi:hypothetical protein
MTATRFTEEGTTQKAGQAGRSGHGLTTPAVSVDE